MIFFMLIREIFYDNGKLLPNFPFQLYPLSSFTIIFLVIHCMALRSLTLCQSCFHQRESNSAAVGAVGGLVSGMKQS